MLSGNIFLQFKYGLQIELGRGLCKSVKKNCSWIVVHLANMLTICFANKQTVLDVSDVTICQIIDLVISPFSLNVL